MLYEVITKYLPHRYPFLLIDRVVEFEADKRVVALKNVTMNEPFFPGHFPHHPVMPGVLIVEAMAQAAAVLSFKSMGTMPDENQVVYFAGIDKVRFKRPVTVITSYSIHYTKLYDWPLCFTGLFSWPASMSCARACRSPRRNRSRRRPA